MEVKAERKIESTVAPIFKSMGPKSACKTLEGYRLARKRHFQGPYFQKMGLNRFWDSGLFRGEKFGSNIIYF